MNVVKETTLALINNQHSTRDVEWVGSKDGKYAMDWIDFESEFFGLNYSAGYGVQEIAKDLVVVLNDHSWLERVEYDGAENWVYKKTPKPSNEPKPFRKVTGDWWATLEDMNDPLKYKKYE